MTLEEMSDSWNASGSIFVPPIHEDVLTLQEELLNVEVVITRMDEIISNSRMPGSDVKVTENTKRGRDANNNFVGHVKDLSDFLKELEAPSKLYTRTPSPKSPSPKSLTVLGEHSMVDSYYEEEEVDYGYHTSYSRLTPKKLQETNFAEEVKISETEHFFAAEREESKRFVIKSVVDPETNQDISLTDAIRGGVVDASSGTYLLRVVPRETISIAAAMYENLIKVQSTTVRKSSEKRSSMGVVTVKMSRKGHGWAVDTVIDLSTGLRIGAREAEELRLIDLSRNVFRDRRNNVEYSLDKAEAQGWITRSEIPDATGMPLETKVTYLVLGVLDRRREKMLPFYDACREGLMDRDTATYYDLLSGKKYSIEDAIGKGFVRVEVVKDTKSVDFWRDA